MPRKIDKIIIHVSDSPDHMDVGMVEINDWHMQRSFTPYNNWIYCGYNYVIRRNGVVECARPDDVAGIHCSGHNSTSIGICWVGRDLMTIQQHGSLVGLCESLMKQHLLTVDQIYGHNDFNKSKTCPNFDIEEFRNKLRGVI